MKKLLITGGTIFVSRYAAEYFVQKGYAVTVLNRNTHPQPEGVRLISADRHALGECLRGCHFDAILDITAYTAQDVDALLDAVGSFETYLLLSSSAVYPETGVQPFTEETPTGKNAIWGPYGTNKIAAEKALLRRVPNGYILRPPYLYGPGNNVYREAYVFDCATECRKFFLPRDGSMKLQFFHVDDLCRMMERILQQKPGQHIWNVGNPESISIRDWVTLCYKMAGSVLDIVEVHSEVPQRNYFPFHDYAYFLDVTRQHQLLNAHIPLEDGLRDSFAWYQKNRDSVNRKPYLAYISENLSK